MREEYCCRKYCDISRVMSTTNPKTEELEYRLAEPNCSEITDQAGPSYSVKEIDLALVNTVYRSEKAA